MLKKALLISAAIVLTLIGYVAWEWDHIALGPQAQPWSPPPEPASTQALLPREPCAQRDPLRKVYWGDLHVHTGYSFDARSRDMLSTPDDAYRFASGEPIGLGPFNEEGVGARTAQLERPLDFAAVTDHAEWIGEVAVCIDPSSPSYNSQSCAAFRGEAPPDALIAKLIPMGGRMMGILGLTDRKEEVCGPEATWCREGLLSAWKVTQAAAEQWYDRSSDCRFTTFNGWEYSNSPGRSKVHRNVIFRNEVVPELPISALEESDPLGLWEQLEAQCNKAPGFCEALSIPHNPNMSNGRMFTVAYRGASVEEERRQARLRARMEPVVEMMQIKGESECRSGLYSVIGEDEWCDFEKIRGSSAEPVEDCQESYGTGAIAGKGCESRLDYVRYAIVEGIREKRRIGVNPYRFGFAGGTDTHNATPGDVNEASFQGCCANTDTSIEDRFDPARGFAGQPFAMRNPGGLMAVWAEENSRGALFEAMQRREVYATSGPRIALRLFAGWELPENLCQGNMVAEGYTNGVPMGGILSAPRKYRNAPLLAVSAMADPGAGGFPGGLLQRLQVIKVWPDEKGSFQQRVYDIAGPVDASASVDETTCEPAGKGASSLCTVWQDPEFEPTQAVSYYVRVLENPSCRWSWRQCLDLPEAERPALCDDPTLPRTIQERAWSSPIWYTP